MTWDIRSKVTAKNSERVGRKYLFAISQARTNELGELLIVRAELARLVGKPGKMNSEICEKDLGASLAVPPSQPAMMRRIQKVNKGGIIIS